MFMLTEAGKNNLGWLFRRIPGERRQTQHATQGKNEASSSMNLYISYKNRRKDMFVVHIHFFLGWPFYSSSLPAAISHTHLALIKEFQYKDSLTQ